MPIAVRTLALAIAFAIAAGATAEPVFENGFETIPAKFQETHCNITRESIDDPVQRALFKPDGFEEALIAWNVLFPPDREYPDSYGDKIAVGSITFYPDRRKMLGVYMTVPFTADDTYHELSHRPATPTLTFPLTNYDWEAADSVYVTVSPCRGDFRTIAVTNPDPDDETYTKGCRKRFHQTEKFVYGAISCPVYPGHRYFLNIVFEEIGDDHLDPTTTSCSTEYSSDGVSPKPQDHICEGGFKHD